MSGIQSENGNIGTNFAPGSKTRVIFADDHKIFRQAHVSLIKDQADIHVLGEASDGEEAIDLARKFNPDVIVMDVKAIDCNVRRSLSTQCLLALIISRATGSCTLILTSLFTPESVLLAGHSRMVH